MSKETLNKAQSLLITKAYRQAIEDISKRNWPKVSIDAILVFTAFGLLPFDIAANSIKKIVTKSHSRGVQPS